MMLRYAGTTHAAILTYSSAPTNRTAWRYLQVQKELLLTPKLVKSLKGQHGERKLCNFASLLKQKSFMARLTSKSRRGPSKHERTVLPNPLGQMPNQIKEQDRQVGSLLDW